LSDHYTNLLSESRDNWIDKNSFFYENDYSYMRFLVNKGSSVLELGCGTLVIATEESGGIAEITTRNQGEITITTGSRQFIQAMNKIKIKEKSAKFDSLLPEAYTQENVVSIFKEWLDKT